MRKSPSFVSARFAIATLLAAKGTPLGY